MLQTGYSVVRSLSEAPNYAAVIAKILKQGHSKPMFDLGRYTTNISKQGIQRILLIPFLNIYYCFE